MKLYYSKTWGFALYTKLGCLKSSLSFFWKPMKMVEGKGEFAFTWLFFTYLSPKWYDENKKPHWFKLQKS